MNKAFRTTTPFKYPPRLPDAHPMRFDGDVDGAQDSLGCAVGDPRGPWGAPWVVPWVLGVCSGSPPGSLGCALGGPPTVDLAGWPGQPVGPARQASWPGQRDKLAWLARLAW